MLRVDEEDDPASSGRVGLAGVLVAIRSMMSQASSPVIFSAARPRMIVMLDGLSCAVIEMATPGITVEVAGLARAGTGQEGPQGADGLRQLGHGLVLRVGVQCRSWVELTDARRPAPRRREAPQSMTAPPVRLISVAVMVAAQSEAANTAALATSV